jgi:hypothetical protein
MHSAAHFYSFSRGNQAVCELLIASKADLDAKDRCGFILNLLLSLLCIILMLLTHPPACSRGDTPLKLAIDENKPDVVALLRSVGASQ